MRGACSWAWVESLVPGRKGGLEGRATGIWWGAHAHKREAGRVESVFVHWRSGRVISGFAWEEEPGISALDCAARMLRPRARCVIVYCVKTLQTAADLLGVWSCLYILCPLDMTGTVLPVTVRACCACGSQGMRGHGGPS